MCGSTSRSKPNDDRVTTTTALRVARAAEVVYAVVAVVLAFGIPLPPRGPGMVLFAHWLGTALLAGAIALRLGRPNRQTWYVAALLAAYVLFNAGVALARLLGPESSSLGRPGVLAIGIGGILWLTQIVVAGCLYQARELRTMPSATTRGS
jgi:peptidoglycan/LPS O-acetylase OafA/YrhL